MQSDINGLTLSAYLLGNDLLSLAYIKKVAGNTLFSTSLSTEMGDIWQNPQQHAVSLIQPPR